MLVSIKHRQKITDDERVVVDNGSPAIGEPVAGIEFRKSDAQRVMSDEKNPS